MSDFPFLRRGRCRLFSDTINWALYGDIKDIGFILSAGFNAYYGDLFGSGEETFPRHMAHRSIEFQREHLGVNRPHVKAIRDAGIAYIYYSSSCTFDATFFDEETISGFACVFESEELAFRTPNRLYACFNSPEWLRFQVDKSEMLVKELEFDGIFFDNTFYLNPCRCRNCIERFHERTGLDLLEVQAKVSVQDTDDAMISGGLGALDGDVDFEALELYQTYSDFRLECVCEFYRAYRRELDKRISRPFAVMANTFINMSEGAELFRADLFDCYYTENGYTYPPESNAFSYKLGNAIQPGERRSVVLVTRPKEAMPTPAMFKAALAEAMANGGCSTPWGFFLNESDNAKAAVRQYIQFQGKHEELLARQSNVADAAVVMPLAASLLKKLAGDEQQYMNNGAHIASRMMCDLNIPHDVLFDKDEWDFDALRRYRLLVLPEVDLLSGHNFDVLIRLADAGTKILSSGGSLRYDDKLKPRAAKLTGDNITHISLPFPAEYCKARLNEDYGEMLRFGHAAALAELYGEGMLKTGAAPLTHLTITASETEILCHFVNYNVNLGPYSIRAIPDYDTKVELAIDRYVTEAWLYSPDAEGKAVRLPLEVKSQTAHFTLPRLDSYAFVLLR